MPLFGGGLREDDAPPPRRTTLRLESSSVPRRSVVANSSPRPTNSIAAPVVIVKRKKKCCMLCCSSSERQVVESLDVLTEEGSDQFDDAFYLPAETNPRQLKEEDRLRLLRLFGRFDRDGNNRVSQREIRIGLTEFGNPPTKAEADQIISQLDLKRGGASDGFVDFEEFALGLLHRRCLLYKALYERHALSGTPASVDEPMDTAERTALSKLRNKSDARAHLSAVISAQTGRRATNFV